MRNRGIETVVFTVAGGVGAYLVGEKLYNDTINYGYAKVGKMTEGIKNPRLKEGLKTVGTLLVTGGSLIGVVAVEQAILDRVRDTAQSMCL